MANPFEEAEAWVPSQVLPRGMHRVKITSVLSTMTARGDKAMVVLELGNEVGTIKDWITLQVPRGDVKGSSIGIQQIVAVYDAAGVYRPTELEFHPNTMRISQSALNRLAAREVGILVVEEERDDRDKPGQKKVFHSVSGYLSPKDMVAGRTFGTGNGGPQAQSQVPEMASAVAADDDDIPF
jgi:hypothetical protein